MTVTKQALRASERARRKERDASYWRRIGRAVEETLSQQLNRWGWTDEVVAGFAALPGEPILEVLPGTTAWPCVDGENLVFRACKREELVPGWRGILEPPASAPEVQPQLILVPGLAFAANGDRMGRGAGFYDRYLNGCPAISVGVTDAAGMRDQIPKASHDVAVDVVLTELGAHIQGSEEKKDGDDCRWRRPGFGAFRWTVRCLA